MPRKSKPAGTKVLVNTGNRKLPSWVAGVIGIPYMGHCSFAVPNKDTCVVLEGSISPEWYSSYSVIADTPKNRAKHGLS